MLDYPFDPATGRRRTVDEAVAWLEQRYGMTLVNGFQQLLGSHGARYNNRRVASIGEFVPFEAWYLDASGPGFLRWETAPVPEGNTPEVVFLLSIGLGNGSALPQPTVRFDLSLNSRPIGSLRVVKHSEMWQNEEATIYYEKHRQEYAPPGHSLILDAELREESSATFGLLYVKVPRASLQPGKSARFEVRAIAQVRSTQWFKVDKGTNIRFHANYYPGFETLAQGRVAPRAGDFSVYWGDVHSHSGESHGGLGTCGVGSVDDNYHYAREVANLDFYALSEHDWQTDAEHWQTLMHKVEQHNDPGRFATIPSFEWTSLVYGHRNVYYPDAARPFFLSWQEARLGKGRDAMGQDVDSPVDLWRKLDEVGVPALTIPHHTPAASHPFNWNFINPRYDRLVEIYSSWGASDFPHNRWRNGDRYPHLYVVPALERGWRLGFVGSSDSHDGHPGNAQSPDFKHQHLYHYLGSGRTAVLAQELTRDAVFDALRERRCYAVTGAPILLDLHLNGHLMGSELQAAALGGGPQLSAEITGTTHLKRIEIVKNGRIVLRQECYEEDYNRATIAWTDPNFNPKTENYYFLKVTQQDDEMAWSSPIWISP